MTTRLFPALVLCTGLLAAAVSGASARTDVVELKNGDRITGEVVAMQRGKLEFDTDDMGTLYIEWSKIERLASKLTLEVELRSGERRFGNLAPGAASDFLRVRDQETGAITEVAIGETVAMAVLYESPRLRDRVDGYVDFGYGDTRSTETSLLTFGAGVNHQDRERYWGLDTSMSRSQTSEESSDKASLGIEIRRFLRNRWYRTGALEFERNEELGVDLRTLLAAGLGRYVFRSDAQELGLVAGLALVKEQNDIGGNTNSTELVLSADYDAFRYDSPKLDMSAKLTVFPSLSVSGRVRVSSDISLRYELRKDLFAELSFEKSYDSDPQSAGAPKQDYTIATSLGYSF